MLRMEMVPTTKEITAVSVDISAIRPFGGTLYEVWLVVTVHHGGSGRGQNTAVIAEGESGPQFVSGVLRHCKQIVKLLAAGHDESEKSKQPPGLTERLFGRRCRLSPLESIRKLYWRKMYHCARCGGRKPAFPRYADGPRWGPRRVGHTGLDGVDVTPVCQACWDELPPEGRLQWVLMLMACWAEECRDQPIDYDPPHSQARYRDWPVTLERVRRVLFESPTLGYPQFGPNYVGYRGCYLHRDQHELFPIPPLRLQICTECRGWFDEAGEPVKVWEYLGAPEASAACERMELASGPEAGS